MKQRFVIFILLLSFALSALAQNATNVRVRQEGETIVITYDLDKKANVRVLVATGQSNQYTELKAVTGSAGKDISAGVNKQIIWQPLQEKTEFVAQNVRFKVEAKPYYYFSVSPTKKVVFSSGNLQYRQSTNMWSFAEHQYDMLWTDNVEGGIAEMNLDYGTYSKEGNKLADKIDLFGWSGSTGSAKWGVSTSTNTDDYSGDFVDWGKNICDGNTWYTLTQEEWDYLCNGRVNAAKFIGVANIQLNEKEYANGLILLPDNWTCPVNVNFKSGFAKEFNMQAYTDYQTLTLTDWHNLESTGAVFLPAAGGSEGLVVRGEQLLGCYNSSTNGDYLTWTFYFHSDSFLCEFYGNFNYLRRSVRLVRDL